MKTSRIAPAILLLTFVALGGARAGEWQSLFNGKDLSGWKPVHDVTFEVHDGNLRLVTGMGWLRTEKEYADFVLEFEYRGIEEKYDSGVFIRAGLEGEPWPKGGWQVNLHYDVPGGLVKGFTSVVPSETPRIPVNRWTKFRITAKGKKVSLDVDDDRAWESEALDSLKGYIGIQAENKALEFRNIRIQEL